MGESGQLLLQFPETVSLVLIEVQHLLENFLHPRAIFLPRNLDAVLDFLLIDCLLSEQISLPRRVHDAKVDNRHAKGKHSALALGHVIFLVGSP